MLWYRKILLKITMYVAQVVAPQLLGTISFMLRIVSSSWYMWCTSFKKKLLEGSSFISFRGINTSTDKKHKECIDCMEQGEAWEIQGIVNNPEWKFFSQITFFFPQLHAEIGLINNVLDNFTPLLHYPLKKYWPETLTLSSMTFFTQMEFHHYNRISVSKKLTKTGPHQCSIIKLCDQQQ